MVSLEVIHSLNYKVRLLCSQMEYSTKSSVVRVTAALLALCARYGEVQPEDVYKRQITASIIAMPGKSTIWGAVRMNSLPSVRMAPHSGVGGITPSPTKLRPAAERITLPMLKVACTMMGPIVFGIICFKMIRKVPTPVALAASISVSYTHLGDEKTDH